MKTRTQERVESLCTNMLAAAKQNLRVNGAVANIVIVVAPPNEMILLKMDDYTRAVQPLAIRAMVRTLKADFVVHVSEAWGAIEILGKEIGLMPSKREDKVELILVHARARDGSEAYRSEKFDRLEQGGYLFSEWKPMERTIDARYQSRLLDDCFE